MSSSSQEPFVRIDVERAKQLVDEGRVEVIDIREPAEFAKGHIPKALSAPLWALMSRPRDFIKRDALLFVCEEGLRSSLACEMAASLGFTELYHMKEGMPGWVARGYPIE